MDLGEGRPKTSTFHHRPAFLDLLIPGASEVQPKISHDSQKRPLSHAINF